MARGDQHHELRDQILLEGSKIQGVILFPYQSGIAKNRGHVFRYGWPGVSDIIGLKRTSPLMTAEVFPRRPDMLAPNPIGQFIALEIKTGRGRTTKEQQMFLDRVRDLGGIAAVVRSLKEALGVLRA